jgi:SAM-dependent methyltransferase
VDVFLSGDEWNAAESRRHSRRDQEQGYFAIRRQSPLMRMYYDWWVAEMTPRLPDDRHGPVAELMSGAAEICRRLPEQFAPLTALDINVDALAMSAEEMDGAARNRVWFVCASAARTPLPDASQQLVMIQGGLHHARSILDQVLREISRILRPGGLLICSEPANDCWIIRAIRRWQYARSAQQGDDEEEDGFTRGELSNALAQHGLYLERYRQFGFLAYLLMGNADLVSLLARSRAFWLGRTLLLIDRLLACIPVVRRLAWASIVSARKEGHQ